MGYIMEKIGLKNASTVADTKFSMKILLSPEIAWYKGWQIIHILFKLEPKFRL